MGACLLWILSSAKRQSSGDLRVMTVYPLLRSKRWRMAATSCGAIHFQGPLWPKTQLRDTKKFRGCMSHISAANSLLTELVQTMSPPVSRQRSFAMAFCRVGDRSLNPKVAPLRSATATIGQPADLAPSMHVLSEKRRSTRRILVHGLVYFGEVFANFMTGDGWDFQYYPDRGLGNLASMTNALRQCDLVYQIGGRVTIGRFLRAAKLFGKRRIVMHWIGSDVLEQRESLAAREPDAWVLKEIHHWADSEWIAAEVSALGVPCRLVPLPSARVPERPSPLPEQFRVLVYVPSVEDSALYGLDAILDVARLLPEVQFELVGLRDGPVPSPPSNISFHKRVPDLAEFYRQASLLWRPTRHDGLSWMVCEALGYGRHVMWTYPFPGCIQATSASEAATHIERLYELHQEKKLQINRDGVCFVAASEYNPQRFKTKIRSYLEKILES